MLTDGGGPFNDIEKMTLSQLQIRNLKFNKKKGCN